METIIKCFRGDEIRVSLDPNPNGLPVLFISTGYNRKYISSMLNKENLEELIKDLQRKLAEM